MTACFFGHTDAAKCLLRHNAAPNRPALDGATPLMPNPSPSPSPSPSPNLGTLGALRVRLSVRYPSERARLLAYVKPFPDIQPPG